MTTLWDEGDKWYIITYEHCGAQWTDEYSCACDSECPMCGAPIEPKSFTLVSEDTL